MMTAAVAALLFAAAAFVLLVPLMREQPVVRLKTQGAQTLAGVSLAVSKRLPTAYRQRLERRIQMAGGLGGMTAPKLIGLSVLGGVIGVLFAVLLLALRFPTWFVIFAPLGAMLPFFSLSDRVRKRHANILRHLPFHIDLLTMSVEAGLDFTAAIGKIVERGKDGPLRDELRLMLSEIRVGTPRQEALRAMAERVQLPQLQSVVSALVQADKLGMSLGRVLRTQSETVRNERTERAEKRANEAPVKILIPLVLFIFPTIWIILAGPLVFGWMF